MMRLGSGSSGCGRTSSRPFDQRAENTPQWDVCGRKGASASGPESEDGLSTTSLIGNLAASVTPVHTGLQLHTAAAPCRHTTNSLRGRNAEFRNGSICALAAIAGHEIQPALGPQCA